MEGIRISCGAWFLHRQISQAYLNRSAELNRHLVPAVAQLTGSDDLAGVGRAMVTGAEDLDFARFTDRQRFLEQERHAADRGVAGGDVVGSVGKGAVQNGQSGLGLDGPAIVTSSVNGGGAHGQCCRWADGVAITHAWCRFP